jgi:hypothetical protein
MNLLPGKVDSFGGCRNNANADAILKDMGLYEAVGQHTQWNTKVRYAPSSPSTFPRRSPFLCIFPSSSPSSFL